MGYWKTDHDLAVVQSLVPEAQLEQFQVLHLLVRVVRQVAACVRVDVVKV